MKQLIFITMSFALLFTGAVANESENEQAIFKVDTNNSKVIKEIRKMQ